MTKWSNFNHGYTLKYDFELVEMRPQKRLKSNKSIKKIGLLKKAVNGSRMPHSNDLI